MIHETNKLINPVAIFFYLFEQTSGYILYRNFPEQSNNDTVVIDKLLGNRFLYGIIKGFFSI